MRLNCLHAYATTAILTLCTILVGCGEKDTIPADRNQPASIAGQPIPQAKANNSLKEYIGLAPWTNEINWDNSVSIADMPGRSYDERITIAQKALGQLGGVIDFPAGEYKFENTILLKNG